MVFSIVTTMIISREDKKRTSSKEIMHIIKRNKLIGLGWLFGSETENMMRCITAYWLRKERMKEKLL